MDNDFVRLIAIEINEGVDIAGRVVVIIRRRFFQILLQEAS